jgi:hypothetical protein
LFLIKVWTLKLLYTWASLASIHHGNTRLFLFTHPILTPVRPVSPAKKNKASFKIQKDSVGNIRISAPEFAAPSHQTPPAHFFPWLAVQNPEAQ